MEVDWITVVAQIVNFLILVYLLKRFLYAPVTRAMEVREEGIAARIAQAEARERDANGTVLTFESKTRQFDLDRETLLAEARDQAESERRRLSHEARDQVAETRRGWERQAEHDKRDFVRKLSEATARAVERIARKALADLADTTLEDQIIGSFLQRLSTLEDDVRQIMGRPGQTVRVATSFDLEPQMRADIDRAVVEHINGQASVEYIKSSDLRCGIELSAGSHRIGWSIDDYLNEFAERIESGFAAATTKAAQ